MTKKFLYDTLLDEENICNLEKEKSLLWAGVEQKKKLIVYGPRNCGKTSLVKNVIVPKFRRKHKNSFVLFCDFMEVKNIDAVHQRLKNGFETAFAESFPKRKLLQSVKNFLKNLRAQVQFDPATGQPSVVLTPVSGARQIPLAEIFETINREIARHLPTLIVLDEFQDIAFVGEAQGLFRQALQEIKDTPVIFMGSKKHILSDIFARPQAPLAFMGEDIEFSPIPYKEYHEYIVERFSPNGISIHEDDSQYLQDALFRIPEAINILCAHLLDTYSHITLSGKEITPAVDRVVEKRATRYQEYLSHFSEKEEKVLVGIAKAGLVMQPSGQDFLSVVRVTPRAVSQIFKRFMNRSIIEKTGGGYRISDPLLHFFLRKFR